MHRIIYTFCVFLFLCEQEDVMDAEKERNHPALSLV